MADFLRAEGLHAIEHIGAHVPRKPHRHPTREVVRGAEGENIGKAHEEHPAGKAPNRVDITLGDAEIDDVSVERGQVEGGKLRRGFEHHDEHERKPRHCRVAPQESQEGHEREEPFVLVRVRRGRRLPRPQ